MERKKLEELIEKNASREEAKKLLKDENLLKEFSEIKEMKEVLSDMSISPPESIAKSVLKKKKAVSKIKKRRFSLAFASALVVVFVSLMIARGIIPFNINSSTAPSFKDTNRLPESGQKTLTPQTPALTSRTQPEIKVTLNKNASEEDVIKAADEYCTWEGKDVCVIEREKVNALIEKLKKYGEVQTLGLETSETRNPEKENKKLEIKIEVMKK